MKILLVEDNELNRDMLSRRLIKRGFTEREDDYECTDCKTNKWGRTFRRL